MKKLLYSECIFLMHLKVDELQLPLHKNFTSEKTTAGILWGNTGKIKLSRTGPKGACYKALVTNSHAPSFLNSGVFERTTSAGSVT